MAKDKKKKLLVEKLMTSIKTAVGDDKTPSNSTESGPSWLNYVAVLTGALAALAGFLAVRSTTLTNDAIYESNQAVLAQAEASDSWAEYQAASIKARIVETQMTAMPNMPAATRAELSKQDMELRDRQPEAKKIALDKAAERDGFLKEGRHRLAEKDLLNYADLAAQLGIALASVAALSKRRTAFLAGILSGVTAAGITAYVFFMHYLVTPQ